MPSTWHSVGAQGIATVSSLDQWEGQSCGKAGVQRFLQYPDGSQFYLTPQVFSVSPQPEVDLNESISEYAPDCSTRGSVPAVTDSRSKH